MKQRSSSVAQEYSSAKTARKQVPALHKKIVKYNLFKKTLGPYLKDKHVNLDMGGGPYDDTTKFFARNNIENIVIDPYNRSDEHNRAAERKVLEGSVTTCTLANVLNVVKEREIRLQILSRVKDILAFKGRLKGHLFIAVYEGDRSGIGRETKCGWQENRPLKDYVGELRAAGFLGIRIQYGVLMARTPTI